MHKRVVKNIWSFVCSIIASLCLSGISITKSVRVTKLMIEHLVPDWRSPSLSIMIFCFWSLETKCKSLEGALVALLNHLNEFLNVRNDPHNSGSS